MKLLDVVQHKVFESCRAVAAVAAVATVATVSLSSPVQAQGYPSKPVRLLVPFPPGGVVDIVARQVSAKMSENMGQPIVIENRGGASGSIGTDVASKAAPDGYTGLFVFDTHAVNPHIYKSLRFDTLKDFAPVSLLVHIPLVIAAHPGVAAKSLPELVALAKAKPDSLSYASVGSGSSGHLAAEQFKLLADVKMVHVPYKGGGPATADLLGGQVPLAFLAAGVLMPHIRAEKVKALAVTGPRRSPAMPDVPTAIEAGYKALDAGAWVGLVMPAGTPQPIVDRLNQEVVRAVQDPVVKAKLAEQAMEVVGGTPAAFGTFIRAEHDKWGWLIREARLNIEP